MAASLVRASRSLLGFAVFVLAIGAWQVWAGHSDSFAIPKASSVLATAWDVWPSSVFLTGVGDSLGRLAVGFLIATVVGVGIGLLIGSSRGARRALDPLVEFSRATPAIAVVPAAMIVLGFGDAMQISVIAFAVCFPILVSTVEGVRAIPPEVHDTASMLHVGRTARVLRIELPGALPFIAAGLRVAVSFGLVAVVLSEFEGENEGLGRYIWLQYAEFDVRELYAGLLFLGLLGYALNRLFLLAERRLLSWHEGFVR